MYSSLATEGQRLVSGKVNGMIIIIRSPGLTSVGYLAWPAWTPAVFSDISPPAFERWGAYLA